MYKVGQNLRQNYGQLLGDIVTHETVNARSSHFPRARISMQLVLAGLFPPKSVQIWQEHFNWQPVDYEFLPRHLDVVNNYVNKFPCV